MATSPYKAIRHQSISPQPKVIKVKSPKSQIKLHKNTFGLNSKVSPDLTIRSSLPVQHHNDDMDKITQAWNKLKINALSKAIAILPEIGSCSFKPNNPDYEDERTLASPVEQPELRNVITSTPMKPRTNPITRHKITLVNKPNYELDISEIKSNDVEKEERNSPKELVEIQALRAHCLSKIESKLQKDMQEKQIERVKKYADNKERIKEQLAAYKMELERENLLRVQQQCIEIQNVMKASKIETPTSHIIQTQVDHEQRLLEASEKIRQIEEKRKELEEKQRLMREELKANIAGVHEMQLTYNKTYSQISEITKKCKDKKRLNELVQEDLPKLKKMNDLFLRLVENCKEGKVNKQDLKAAQVLVQQITLMVDIFTRKTDQANREKEKAEEEIKLKAQQNEEEKRRQQMANEEAKRQQLANEEAKKQQQAAEETRHHQQTVEENKKQQMTEENKKDSNSTNVDTRIGNALEDCISMEDLKTHLELSKYLENYENCLKPLLNNNALKKFRIECQKVVNVPVNAISPQDDLHLEDKFFKLSRLLQGQPVPQGTEMFYTTGDPLGVPYCTNLLAMRLVKQGELVVSSKPEAAYAIAAVITSLWAQFPDFGRLLLAHFHRECPYLIPAFMPQLEGQSDQDYYKKLGYQYSSDGKVESQVKFLKRMSGVMRLYAAITVTGLKRSLVAEGKKHPHDIRQAWRWLAATLNLKPRPDVSPTLLYDFLEVAGHRMFTTYGPQFNKLLHLLCAEYFPQLEQVTPESCSGPVVRLKQFLEKIVKEGRVAPPIGLLPDNFW